MDLLTINEIATMLKTSDGIAKQIMGDTPYLHLGTGKGKGRRYRRSDVLPMALATTITITANIREWRHIFNLRCDKAAHPDMVLVMTMARDIARGKLPVFFEVQL